jgi:hypothetical protein
MSQKYDIPEWFLQGYASRKLVDGRTRYRVQLPGILGTREFCSQERASRAIRSVMTGHTKCLYNDDDK